MEKPVDKFQRCIHQMIRWSLKMIYLDVFDNNFCYSLGYYSVLAVLQLGFFGCWFTVLFNENKLISVFALGASLGLFQVNMDIFFITKPTLLLIFGFNCQKKR